ncbi:putative signal recognition particle 68 kDa protein [Toxoplasma gondii RUB]|uniref:Signal recognition particle subunit SRP68 n=1 Tax=Toxoplasma gondii RUB TaxID=935652 RepID=A0A086M863_TOXGO|nr:putative signal recognition particle 68 kDa protein [Toxoplasma gondii RUB]
MAETLEAERPEGAFRSFSLSLSLYVEERREANGLRHGDFLRYRRYCSARLDRLRASLELRQGRNRFQQKKLPVVIRDERVLLLVLTQAERAWSYAMQLKGENAASAVVNLRVRRHCIRRLSKALLYARLLENLCHSETPCMQSPPPPVSDSKAAKGASGKKDETKSSGKKPQAEEGHALLRQPHALPAEEVAAYFLSLGCECVSLCDEKTKLESRAYRLSILAALEQEQENWEAARETLEELRQVYIHLKRVSSTHERETALFKTLLARTEPELRLCAFHSGGVASLAKAGLAGSDRGEKTSGEKRMQSSCPALVVWRGDEVFVEAEKPRKGVLGALSLVEEVQLLKTEALTTLAHADSAFEDSTLAERLEALSQEDAERLVERYGDLSSRFRLCVDLIHAEMLKHPDVPSWYLAEAETEGSTKSSNYAEKRQFHKELESENGLDRFSVRCEDLSLDMCIKLEMYKTHGTVLTFRAVWRSRETSCCCCVSSSISDAATKNRRVLGSTNIRTSGGMQASATLLFCSK